MYWRTAGVLLALRPLSCVFSSVELALCVLIAFVCDRSQQTRERVGAKACQALPSQARVLPQKKSKKTAATRKQTAAVAVSKPAMTRSDRIGSGMNSTAGVDSKSKSPRDASVRGESSSSAATDDESVDSYSTSDTFALSTPSACHGKRDQTNEPGFSDSHFTSMVMSRCSSEVVPRVDFMHKSGELQIRGDSVLSMFKPWRKCNILLSVMTGELFVHHKAKTPPQVFPLARFTGASIHSKRRHSFKVVFDGHPPLYFRAAKPLEAENWVKALEYAKEATWRLWA